MHTEAIFTTTLYHIKKVYWYNYFLHKIIYRLV